MLSDDLARIAWEEAPRLCEPDCRAYHRAWPLIRRLGLGAGPEGQGDFLGPAVADCLAHGGSDVLVSGAADEALVRLVAEAASRPPAFTVLDRCATPLRLNAEYARRAGLSLSTVRSDILDYLPGRRFDLIVTHSFLTSFAPASLARLMGRWFELLRPGGRVVTVVRVRPDGAARRFTAEGAGRLAEEVQLRAPACPAAAAIPADRLADAVHRYATSRPGSHPFRALEEVTTPFLAAGFGLREASLQDAIPRVRGIEGPGLARDGSYACVIAARPTA